MFRKHWGDLPIIPDTESGIAALEREQITKPRALEIEGAKLHEFSNRSSTQVTSPEKLFSIDPLTLHTIQLVDHARKLRIVIQQQQEQQQSQTESLQKVVESEGAGGLLIPVSTSSLPSRPHMPAGAITGRQPGDISGMDGESDFVHGKGVAPPALSFHAAQNLLRRTVAVICAHAGFQTSSDLVLDTLTSVVHEYFFKMCSLLRVATDREALTGTTGFVDVMEEVFHELGLGSVTCLHHFYQKRVLGYHNHVLQTCQQLEEELERLRTPQSGIASEETKGTKIQPADVGGVSEIRFPMPEDMDLVNSGSHALGVTMQVGEQTPPPLEELHGALQTMEGSTSLKEEAMKWLPPQVALRNKDTDSTQNALDPDEIINVSDTPEPASGSEMEQTPASVVCDPLTLSPGDTTAQICKPPRKKKKK